MSKAEQTRQFIIEKTTTLFNKNGYAGTSLADITEATGLTKGSIYGNFKNKEEVALAVFTHSAGELSKKLDAAVSAQTTAYDQLIAFTIFYRNHWNFLSEKGGCPMLNAATEVDDALPFMKQTVQRSFALWIKKITAIIDAGIAGNEFKAAISPTEYAQLFVILIEGGVLLSKISDGPDPLYLALNRIVQVIHEELLV